MTRTSLAAVVASLLLSACAANPDSYVAGRAENDLMRFSAASYTEPGAR